MEEYSNLTIIGTSHISIESIKEVSSFINNFKPEIIALELDAKRFMGITQKRKQKIRDVLSLGLKGYFLNLVGAYIEKKLGEIVGVKPGSEMIEAIELAKKHSLNIALIDQDISITLKKLGKIKFKEKIKIVKDILKGVFLKKERVEFDLKKIPKDEVVEKLIDKVKENYPQVHEILIKERNDVMAKALNKIMNLNKEKRILAIIGKGHEKEVIKLIRILDHS